MSEIHGAARLEKLEDREDVEQERVYGFEEAYELQRCYVCAVCWHGVIATPAHVEGKRPGTVFRVTCTNANCQCYDGPTNFVTENYANHRRFEAHVDAYHAREALSVILPRTNHRKDAEILKEIGF